MSKKDDRRAEALKREKRKKIILIAVCAVLIAAIAAAIAYTVYQNKTSRVFSDGNQRLILRDNGTFDANDFHGIRRRGTYTETDTGDVTIIEFIIDGRAEQGSIIGNVLTLPSEWDDSHGHGNVLTLN